MEEFCRLCASKSSPLTSAFSLKNGRLLSDMINIVCPIKIEISDKFPKKICQICLKIILDAIELREKSILSEETFRSGRFNDEPVRVKVEDPFPSTLWFEDSNNTADNHHQNDNDDDEMDEESSIESPAENDEEMIEYFPQVKDRITCTHCPQTFSYRQNLARHIVKMHKHLNKSQSKSIEPKIKCQLCGIGISHHTNVKRHMMRFHSEELPFPCDECTLRFKSEAKLNSHKCGEHNSMKKVESKREQSPPTPPLNDSVGNYKCNDCLKTFTLRHNLNRHYKRFHSSELPYQCVHCNDRFRTESHLERHVFREHEDHGKQIIASSSSLPTQGESFIDKCQFCAQDFNGSKYRYERHMITMHRGELTAVYSCDICPKQYVYLQSLKFHIDMHRKKRRQEKFPFKCRFCVRKFLNEENYQIHLKSFHDNNSTFVCYACGKVYHSNARLENHLKRHADIRDFNCAQCSLKFFTARDLDRHLASHSDLRPYICGFENCRKTFKHPDHLRKHVRKVHKSNCPVKIIERICRGNESEQKMGEEIIDELL